MALSQTIKTSKVTYEQPTGLFINNEFVQGVEGKTFNTINPHDESVICAVHEATEKDVDIAVAAARTALSGEWRTMRPTDRGRCLNKLAELFEQHSDTIAAIESLDNGKAFKPAKNEVQMAADCLRYYGGWADKVHGQVIDTDHETFNYTRHEPIGVCGQIIPWNFPIVMWAWKVGPAAATGNTVVLKSSELTPLSALYAGKLVKEAGFPAGVINIISGFGKTAGSAISSHMGIDKIAFTGSTLVGRQILEAAAKSNLKKVTLELGGKSPNIIFNDADLKNAITWVNFGIYYNHGQVCCAGSRILVQEGIYDKFMAAFKERALQNTIGDPFDDKTFQGPQISETQLKRILCYIEEGKKAGAVCEIGGERVGDKGYYIKPTIFTNVTEDMSIVKEEIFGPVCVVQTFKDEADAIRIANDTQFGLAAAVHTRDINTALRVSNSIHAGTVWVNTYNQLSYQTPFGGFKESGIGRELGKYALDNYTQVKAVIIRTGDALC
ncbi:aldehyde dehydrogenase (NAD(P)(+)) ald5 [Ascosphaera aggregata]|nr:aldehyde dehydrogenase (NAD(P)(+)) ald5 [Ascosphaera aggregata]